MQAIKSFLYLDEYKMYSISSQVFEGITEYLIDYQGSAQEQGEQQKGPIGSGKVMADILKSESGTQERKYLHDYSYNLFEDRLLESHDVLDVSAKSINEVICQVDDSGFVRVRAKAVFNDMNIINNTLKEFNKIGEALAYAGSHEEINNLRQQLNDAEEAAADRNEKARLRQRIKQLTNIESLAKNRGLHQDPKFLENLTFLLDYGFQDQFEVQMPIGAFTFSADLKREYLREREHLMVRKYSRFSEREFVLFGTIAQGLDRAEKPPKAAQIDSEPQHMKAALMQIVQALSNVEDSFTGKMMNEVIIDPIALYSEL